VALGATVVARAARPAADDAWAIVNARIVPVSGAPIERGTVLIRNGLVEAVGPAVQTPPDARVLDAAGMTVYPGLVDALVELEEEDEGRRGGPQQPQQRRAADRDNPPGIFAARDALTLVKPGGRFDAMRESGITTALVVPKSGIFRGRSALVNLAGETPQEMAVKTETAVHVGFAPQGGFGVYPSSLMGVVSVIRQTLVDAAHHQMLWKRYRETPRGMERPAPSENLDALAAAVERRVPVVMEAQVERDIRRALSLAKEMGLRPVIAGGREAWKAADALKASEAPVLLSLEFPERSADQDPETAEALRVVRARVEAPLAASRLHQAGVRFAFQSGGLKQPRQYRENAIKAIKAGLPKEVALRAMTLTPAEIFGVSEQLGSIEVGKIANLVVTTGDLFEEATRVRYVFVDGQRFEVAEREAPKPADGAAAPANADVAGTWELSVDTPQGRQPATLVLSQSGTAVTGTISNPLVGSSDINSGAVSGSRLTFSVSLNIQGQLVEATVEATVDASSMQGTMTLSGQGALSFTGTRPQKGGANAA
jgi:imidazolonepropionase-like amidohydrolase